MGESNKSDVLSLMPTVLSSYIKSALKALIVITTSRYSFDGKTALM